MYRYSLGRKADGSRFSLASLKKRFQHLHKGSIVKNLILLGLGIGLLGALVLFGLFAYYSIGLPKPDSILNREVDQSTKIYDRTGEHLLYEIAPDQKRTLVTIDDIPDNVEKATITAEDRGFYDHGGISIKGIMRALFSNVVHLDATGQGASTITQQFVKKAILTDEQTLTRKIKEIMIALALEKKFTKDEILQLYLNEIPYGGTNYGIESAAQAYFHVPVGEVTLAQAATLAALPNQPGRLINNPDMLRDRKNWILDGMVSEGYVTKDEAEAAKSEDTPVSLSLTNIEAPHFVLWVKQQLEEKYSERTTSTGGLKVITTLDYDKQKIAEEAVTNGVATNGTRYNFNDVGLVSVDPKTGQILAMVGSPDYWNDAAGGQVNTTLQLLQPGSSIKPLVYAAAFERGYTPNTILWDVKTTFPTATGPYNPNNYSGGENGSVTMRKALQGSLNIPAVKTLYLVGIENAVNFMQRMGYTTVNDPGAVGLSMVLGGIDVTLLEHTNAYATLANNGLHHETSAILSVSDSKGNILEAWTPENNKGTEAISKNLAATISNVLSDNNARAYVFSLSNYLTLSGRPAAAKTGTTNDFKDAWTMGYTPSLATGVWVGNFDGTYMNERADGSVVAAPIWKEYMDRTLKGTPVESFPAPDIKGTGKPILDGKIPSTTVVIDKASGKLATASTPERFREEKVCGEYHNILHYVRRSDPTGSAPKNPDKEDSQYVSWEAGLNAYITRMNAVEGAPKMENCVAPTEEDDVHVKRNEPIVTIREPDNGSSVDRTLDLVVDVETRLPFGRLDYSIDGTFIATSPNPNGGSLTLPGWVSAGEHTLIVAAYDNVDNKGQDTIQINVTGEGSIGAFRITNPFNGQTIEKTGSDYSLAIEVPNASNFTSLSITAQNMWTNEVTMVADIASPQAITTVPWALPASAQYSLKATARTISGQTLEAPPITVLVKEKQVENGIPVIEGLPAPVTP